MFNLYKKLQYLKKLLIADRLSKVICDVKKLCTGFRTTAKYIGGFEGKMEITAKVDMNKLRMARLYGDNFEEIIKNGIPNDNLDNNC